MKFLKITNDLVIDLEKVRKVYKDDESNYIFYIGLDEIKVTYHNRELRDREFNEIIKMIGAKELWIDTTFI